MDEGIHEECGVAAVFIPENSEANNRAVYYLYKLLLNLQHRGQLAAGISTFSKKRLQMLDTYKNLGSVNEVFKTGKRLRSLELFRRYAGNKGIGHVRYATFGKDERAYAQPFERHHGRLWKWFAFSFNGNIANYDELKAKLMAKKDYHLTLEVDTEMIMHYLSKELMGDKKPDLVNVFSNLAKQFDGAYNIMFINAYGDMVIARDPYGFRPLCYGFKEGMLLAASESNALLNCGVDKKDIKYLEPGMMILIKEDKIAFKRFAPSKRSAHCMFEWVYFSNVASTLDSKSVYITRTNLGKELAKLETEKVNPNDYVVVPVPDTAKAAGDAYAYELGVPSKEGLIRNRFVGRTFIEGRGRDEKVQTKYTALHAILEGKKVLLVDDSIVRGTTLREIVHYLKNKGGAKEVHVRVSCPPIVGPCFYGIDMSSVSELLVPRFLKELKRRETDKEVMKRIAKDVGADSLIYQTIPGLVRSIGLPESKLCTACITGNYPTPAGKKWYRYSIANFRKGIKEDRRIYECG